MKRGKIHPCPFALPVSLACEQVGDKISQMEEVLGENSDNPDYSVVEKNFKKLFYIITGEEKYKRRCPYAEKVNGKERIVYCTHGIPEEQEATQFSIEGSPTQINVFDTNPTNNGLPLYGDSSFTDDNIRDIPLGLANVGRENSKLT
tara:strand:+ start:5631 stop:6071 length:441 start_codon:yes stop_codon:yes gene_type:complete